MAVAPVQWAMARGHTVGKNIGYQMDADAARAADHDNEAQRLNPGDPDQPSAPRGPLNNLDRLVNWYTHKTSGFKTSGFKTSVFKTSGFKTSGLQNV
jgi:hypothetical protein